MTDLSAKFRDLLQNQIRVRRVSLDNSRRDRCGTGALLLQLADGQKIETVIIPGGKRRTTVCVSTQVGCPVACVFCASGMNGLVRKPVAR